MKDRPKFKVLLPLSPKGGSKPEAESSPLMGQSRPPQGKPPRLRLIKNPSGQGTVEYLLLVALIAVGTMGVLRALSHTISAKFATVGAQIAGEKKTYRGETDFNQYVRKKDMGNFFDHAASEKSK